MGSPSDPSTQLRALEGEIEAHDKAASPGPWAHDLNGFIAQPGDDGEWGETLLMTPRCPTDQNKRDADFAAFARTALPQLLTIAKELETALLYYQGQVHDIGQSANAAMTENATLKRRLDEAMKGLRFFADWDNWKRNGLCDPNSGNFDAVTYAQTRITEIDKL